MWRARDAAKASGRVSSSPVGSSEEPLPPPPSSRPPSDSGLASPVGAPVSYGPPRASGRKRAGSEFEEPPIKYQQIGDVDLATGSDDFHVVQDGALAASPAGAVQGKNMPDGASASLSTSTPSTVAMRAPCRRAPKRWNDDELVVVDKLQEESEVKLPEAVTGSDVAEVYSPPRVTQMAKQLGMRSGFALDLSVPGADGRLWDFSKPEARKRAWQLVLEGRPYMLILSPPCTAFSSWQALNKARHASYGARYSKVFKDAMVHVMFSLRLAQLQMD